MTSYEGHDTRVPPPPPRPIEYRDVDASGWWVSLLIGVLLVGLGVWMLTNLFDSVIVLAWIAGVSLIVGGIVEVAALGGRRQLGWVAWLGAALLIGAGIVVLVWPDITLVVLALTLGIRAVVTGLIAIGTGWQMHRLCLRRSSGGSVGALLIPGG